MKISNPTDRTFSFPTLGVVLVAGAVDVEVPEGTPVPPGCTSVAETPAPVVDPVPDYVADAQAEVPAPTPPEE